MSGKSQTIGDFTASRLSQILPTNENSKSEISPIVWDGREQIWRIGSVSIFPTRPRFLRWSAIIPDKWKLKFVSSGIVGDVGDGFRSLPIPQIAGLQSPHHASFNFWRTFHFWPNSSGESERQLWRLSDISGTAGKKWKPRSSGIFPPYENYALVVNVISMEFLQSFLWRHFSGKPVVATRKFLRLPVFELP